MSFTNCGNRIFHQQTLILHHIHKFSSGNTLGIWICFNYGVKKIKLIALNPTLKVAIKKKYSKSYAHLLNKYENLPYCEN